jgi:hypothetical protein
MAAGALIAAAGQDVKLYLCWTLASITGRCRSARVPFR